MTPKKLVRAAVIAAVYVVVCLALAPLSFGPVQIRFAEALTLLPVLCPEAILGVTVGCFLSNLIASAPIDMVLGTLATLLAAAATYKLRHVRFKGLPVAAALPPVVFNALIVGAELTVLYHSLSAPLAVWLYNMATVGLGQVVSCVGLGLLLVWAVEKQPVLKRIFAG